MYSRTYVCVYTSLTLAATGKWELSQLVKPPPRTEVVQNETFSTCSVSRTMSVQDDQILL